MKQAQPAVSGDVLAQFSGERSATVAVTLDASGKVVSARIYQSSGIPVLDTAALDAAKRSAYAPGETNCTASGGTFAVQFAFAGNAPSGPCPRDVQVVRLAETDELRQAMGGIPISVEITVGADGKLTEAHIVRSSGILQPDQAAIYVARLSTYAPKLVAVPVRRQAAAGQTAAQAAVECRAVTGTSFLKFNGAP